MRHGERQPDTKPESLGLSLDQGCTKSLAQYVVHIYGLIKLCKSIDVGHTNIVLDLVVQIDTVNFTVKKIPRSAVKRARLATATLYNSLNPGYIHARPIRSVCKIHVLDVPTSTYSCMNPQRIDRDASEFTGTNFVPVTRAADDFDSASLTTVRTVVFRHLKASLHPTVVSC
jgi:hypothetical protein